jgi:6-phosphogluconolactonase
VSDAAGTSLEIGSALVRIFPAQATLNPILAQEICRCAEQSIEERGRFTWVLSGGSTPRSLYELLAASPWRERIDWSRVDFFWSDERPVPPDHEDSNYRMARTALLEPLRIDPVRVHRMHAEWTDLEAAAMQYERDIVNCLGASANGEMSPFDLALIGLGEDGHTASLFPFTRALDEVERSVVANGVPQLAVTRLTMTHPRLNRARSVIFLVCGKNKAPALTSVLQGPFEPQRFPAQLIRAEGRCEWFVDSAAAGLLDPAPRT